MVMVSGCGVFRKALISGDEPDPDAGIIMYSDIAGNNIATGGLFVRRGRVESLVDGERDRFTINLRVSADGIWLVSIRSFAGIEIARIHADREAITILDRLSRRATVIGWDELNRQFGLTYSMLPLIMGDVPENRNLLRKRVECAGEVPFSVDWADVIMTTDCSAFKMTTMILRDNAYGREVKIRAEGFRISAGGLAYPEIIEVIEEKGIFFIRIALEDVETGWNGNIDFDIPSGYKIER